MYKKSLQLFPILEYIKAFWLGAMISILFLKFVGLNDVEISAFHLIMGILVFLFEVPTGSFADRFSYKKSIILSYFFLSLAFLSFVIASIYGKWVILFGTSLLFSLSSSFHSGAANAYIFTLHKIRKEIKFYLKYQVTIKRNSSIIHGFAILIGAYLYNINELIPYFIQFILVLIATILATQLESEPVNSGKISILNHIEKSAQTFIHQKIFIYLTIFFIFGTVAHDFFHHVINQSIFLEVGFSVEQIGLVGIFSNFFAGLLMFTVPLIWRKLGERGSYLLYSFLAFLIPSLFIIFSHNLFYITLLTGFIYLVNWSIIALLDYSIQVRTEDNHRATILSIISMFSSLPIRLGFIGFSLGLINKTYIEMIGIIGFIFGIIGIFFTIFFLKKFLNTRSLY